MSARWSLGVLIGLPVAGLLLLACLIGIVAGLFIWRADRSGDSYYGDNGGLWFAIGSFGVAIVVVGATGAFMWPWNADYHKWLPKAGTVASVNSRFLSVDKGTTQRFVIRYTDGRYYGCDDTRCSLVKPGDHLTLSCKKEYQYSGVSGWACSYVRDDEAATR